MRVLKLTGILASSLIFTTPQVMALPLEMSLNGGTAFELKDTVDYSGFFATPSSLVATANQAIICHNRTNGTSSANIQMQINDPNGSAATNAKFGVLAFSQSIGGDSISVTTDNVTRCVTEDGFLGDAASDLIFANGFESGTSSARDLSVGISGLGNYASPNQQLSYEYVISNNGGETMTFDFVDYFPSSGHGLPYLADGSWSCSGSGSGSCGSNTSGTGAVELQGASLAQGDILTVTVSNRTVNSSSPVTAGTSIEILAAIFTDNDSPESNNIAFRSLAMTNNTPPTISSIGNITINEDTASNNIAFTVGDSNGTVASVTASSNNPTVIPNANIALAGSGASRTVTITPAANQYTTNTPVTITITVTDNGGATAETSFTVTVNPVNDAPSFTACSKIVYNLVTMTSSCDNGSTRIPFNGFISNINMGANESSQQVSSFNITALSDAANIFSVGGTHGKDLTIYDSGEMNFGLSGNYGTATITATLTDDGGTSNGGVDTSAPINFDFEVLGPSVKLTQKVYATSAGAEGSQCLNSAVATNSLTSVSSGTIVTFCYIIENTGGTYLQTTQLSDNDLNWSLANNDLVLMNETSNPSSLPLLVPNSSVSNSKQVFYREYPFSTDLVSNGGSVTLNPVDQSGNGLGLSTITVTTSNIVTVTD